MVKVRCASCGALGQRVISFTKRRTYINHNYRTQNNKEYECINNGTRRISPPPRNKHTGNRGDPYRVITKD